MAKEKQIHAHEISRGVSYESFKKGVQETFETIVKPQVEAEKHLTAKQKKVILSPQEKAYANCHSPY